MRKTVKLFWVVNCLMLVSLHTVGAATIDKNYSKSSAAYYAKMWAKGYNTAGYYKSNLDCTNFASQCIEQGGKRRSSKLPSYEDVRYWRPHSATWENATYFKKYWSKRVVCAGKEISSLNDKQKNAYASLIYKMIEPGDVVQYGYSSDEIKHSQVSYDKGKSSKGFDTLLMAQHTSNMLGIMLHDYISTTNYSYVVYYNMGKKK